MLFRLHACRELHCVPDIWSLIEWSNILTPRNLHRRYDTVFYLCFCENKPSAIADGEEVFDAKVGVQLSDDSSCLLSDN